MIGKPLPEDGDTRVVETFIWFPERVFFGEEWRHRWVWWERVRRHQRYTVIPYEVAGWVTIRVEILPPKEKKS